MRKNEKKYLRSQRFSFSHVWFALTYLQGFTNSHKFSHFLTAHIFSFSHILYTY